MRWTANRLLGPLNPYSLTSTLLTLRSLTVRPIRATNKDALLRYGEGIADGIWMLPFAYELTRLIAILTIHKLSC